MPSPGGKHGKKNKRAPAVPTPFCLNKALLASDYILALAYSTGSWPEPRSAAE